MKLVAVIVTAVFLAACSSSGKPKAPAAGTSNARNYQLTDTEKVGNALNLTFATSWRSIQCSAAIDGLKVGSGQGTSLAGVAKMSIYVPAKYDVRPARDFVIECSQF